MFNKVIGNIIESIVDDSLDWFFKRVLKDHYDKRREIFIEAKNEATLAIDYILRTHINDETNYPPNSANEWNKHFITLSSSRDRIFQKLLLIYLKLDASSYLSQNESLSRSRTKDKNELMALDCCLNNLLSLPISLDFTNTEIQLSSGLWAVDNADTNLIVSSLSCPSINLAYYFESPQDIKNIIQDGLITSHQPQMALFLSKVHRCENWDEKYDAIYAFLLVSSGQLIEALKYERMFSDRKNYPEILQRFFELCSKWNAIKSLNCLNLSVDEEEVLNQHMVNESRSATPSGTQSQSQKHASSSSRPKPRNRNIQVVQRTISFNDSPARNTRSARKKKTVK